MPEVLQTLQLNLLQLQGKPNTPLHASSMALKHTEATLCSVLLDKHTATGECGLRTVSFAVVVVTQVRL